ncbi:MAG: AAA family ATPase [Bacteroidales bacterium]|nr:AAA family ATPase [Bacteroidales bacterium]
MVIYLTGFMGSGKSTLGKKLASLAGLPFIDLDREVELREKSDIATIFSERGELCFREAESKALRAIDTGTGAVIATGGGAPCFNDNMEFMNQTGITVYLRLTPAALTSRLEGARETRPLIEGLNGEKLLEFVEQKLREREPYYLQSAIVYEGLGQDARALLKEIRSKGGVSA